MEEHPHRAVAHRRIFLIQDEHADLSGAPFDTISVMGVDDDGHGYFSRTFENHGYYWRYALSVDGATWTLTGDTERATTNFSDGNRKQDIV